MCPVDLPTTPPPLHQKVALTDTQVRQIEPILARLSRDLEGLPVVLAQQAEVVAMGGISDTALAEHLAHVADRIWRGGAGHPAREIVRFEEETVEQTGRTTYLLYSQHVEGALTLVVGWQMSISLTQVRAEVADAREALLRLLS